MFFYERLIVSNRQIITSRFVANIFEPTLPQKPRRPKECFHFWSHYQKNSDFILRTLLIA